MKLFKHHHFLVLLDQAVYSGTGFLSTIFLARILRVENFGIYSGFILVLYLLISVLSAFVIQPFQVCIGNKENATPYISFTYWFQLLAMFLLTSIGLMLVWILPNLVSYGFVGLSIGFLLHDFGRKLLLALNKPVQTLVIDFLYSISTLCALYAFFHRPNHSVEVLCRYLAVSYLPVILLVTYFIHPSRIQWNDFFTHLKEHYKQGRWLFLTALSQWGAGNSFVVASGLYLGPSSLGALRLSQSLMGILNVLLQTFENYVLPQTAIKMNRQFSDGLSFLSSMSRKAAWIFIPILLLTFLFAENILAMAGGSNYSSYAYVLKGMVLLYILVFLSQPVRLIMRALLLNQYFFYGYLMNLVFALLFGHWLLLHLGLTGALLGLVFSQIIVMVYWTIILKNRNIFLWRSFISF